MYQRDPDYYAILNVSDTCTPGELQEQFHRLVKVFHPDRNGGDPWCEAQLKRYNAAYAVLSDPATRAAYDERHARRSEDRPSFDEAFEAIAVPVEPTDVRTDWEFDAAATNPPAAEPATAVAGSAGPLNGLFDGPAVTVTASAPANHRAFVEDRRSRVARYAVAGFACAALIAMAVVTISRQANDDDIRVTRAAARAQAEARNLRLGVGRTAARAAVLNPVTSVADVQMADAARHTEEEKVRRLVAPYWQRFQRVQPGASDVVSDAQRLLTAMQTADRRTLGAPATPDTSRYQQEAKLWTDLNTLRDRISETQDHFDDLRYETSSDELTSSLKTLDQQIRALEQRSDPIYADLGITRSKSK